MRYKFRAWDNVADEMIYAGENNDVIFVLGSSGIECTDIRNVSPSGDGVDSIEHLIYMQWTGLTDRNGKEIYEGDIVEHDAEDNGVWKTYQGCEIVYDSESAMFCFENDGGNPLTYFYRNLVVIGNIYEGESE